MSSPLQDREFLVSPATHIPVINPRMAPAPARVTGSSINPPEGTHSAKGNFLPIQPTDTEGNNLLGPWLYLPSRSCP